MLASTKLCTAISVHGSSEGGAHDPVLDEPRPGRAGDHTDNDQQHGGHDRDDRNTLERSPARAQA